MHLVLNAAEDAAHEKWLRETPGAYEWWYFDARSDCGTWAIACIWFLGNPFSPYYRLAAQGKSPDPFTHNALFFALYRDGKLHAYHFTRFPVENVEVPAPLPGVLRLGQNTLTLGNDGVSDLRIADMNGNGRSLEACLRFDSQPLLRQASAEIVPEEAHFWLPAAPSCRVSGQITLGGSQNNGPEAIAFSGRGYHDHNWGSLPFDAQIKEWYWARAALDDDRAIILYHVQPRRSDAAVSHLLLFEAGRLLLHDASAKIQLSRRGINAFGTVYARRLTAESGNYRVQFDLGTRLDSAPFYLRVFCAAALTRDGETVTGQGIGEYFRPAMLASPITASATKARIVVR